MNKKSNYLKLSTLFFSLLLAVVFSLAIPNTSEAASPGSVTNVKQIYGSYYSSINDYLIAVQFNRVSGASYYMAEISTDNVNWEWVDAVYKTSNTSTETFYIRNEALKETRATLKAGSVYYVRITAIDSAYNYSTSAPLQVVTAPATVSGTNKIIQTACKSNSLTASWSSIPGATGYQVYVKKFGDTDYSYVGDTKSTSFNVTKYKNKKLSSDSIYYVGILPTKTSNAGFTAICNQRSNGYGLCTLPSTTKKIIANDWKPGTSKLSISWTKSSVATGYELQFYNAKGKSLKKATVKNSAYGTPSYTLAKAPKYSFCSVKIRPYVKSSTGKKFTSSWSKKTYFVSQSSIKKDFSLTDGKLSIKWNKVKGASKYLIYAGTSSKNMKKVATVSSKKTSYTITKVGGSTVSKHTKYFVKVVPQKKVSKKTYKGDYGWYTTLRVVYY